MWFNCFLTVCTAYLLGNLNGAVLASHLVAHEDVRQHGSGNAGLTNFVRNYGARSAVLVIFTDMTKAVLSGVTVALCLDWRIGLFVFGIFLLAYLATGYVSLGSILSSGSFGPIYAIFHRNQPFAICVGFILSILIVWLHRANIVRLVKGQERKTNLLSGGKQK